MASRSQFIKQLAEAEKEERTMKLPPKLRTEHTRGKQLQAASATFVPMPLALSVWLTKHGGKATPQVSDNRRSEWREVFNLMDTGTSHFL
jgi:hypothetical protein